MSLHRAASAASPVETATRLGLIAVGVAGAGLVCRMPVLLCLLFAGAAVIAASTREWPWWNRGLTTLVAAGFAAQLTGVFVSPFTFPLRLGFFFVMIGLVVAYVGSQNDTI